jgi:predicted hotdog family 3-hydroxylacyl-ACP dehydratase
MVVYPPIEELVPHRGAMLLLDEIVSYQADSIVARASVARDAWYADERGAMPAWIGVELMAQAAAACAGMEARKQNAPPRAGMLVGCRAYRATSPTFSGTLKVSALRTASDESGFSLFDCGVSAANGAALATGTLQVLLK